MTDRDRKTDRARKPPQVPPLVAASMASQDEGLKLLLAEIRALQTMIALGGSAVPTEAGFDNMPV